MTPAAWLRAALLLPLLVQAGACERPSAAPASAAEVAQVVSPLGHTYVSLADTAGTLADADSALATRPGDVGTLLDAAASYATLWRYRHAIALYDSAIALDPSDWRPWRFRGHRHISLRDFDAAVRDLEEARRLSAHSFDVAYHLGLAHYLRGDFDRAADAYATCMDLATDSAALALEASGALPAGFRTCMGIATIDNDRVAMTEWRWRALRRAGRMDEAARLLDAIRADMDVGTNAAYHDLLMLHRGDRSVDVVFDTTRLNGNQFETIGYGVAVQWLTEGDTARAVDLMRRIIARDDRWQAFGFIAAEQDLVRLTDDEVR